MEIKNATTVHRIWNGCDEADLLAGFQYDGDAEALCQTIIDRQNEHVCMLVSVNHYTGAMKIFRRRAPQVAE